ncbi:hypothetical protein ACWEKR_34530 [Nocardia sp. NPDC004573]
MRSRQGTGTTTQAADPKLVEIEAQSICDERNARVTLLRFVRHLLPWIGIALAVLLALGVLVVGSDRLWLTIFEPSTSWAFPKFEQ